MIHKQQMNWKRLRNSDMDWSILHKRSAILQAVRNFFIQHDFWEVDAPHLTPYPTLDANIAPIASSVSDTDGRTLPLYLHTSPEHAMKKLLAAGAERIFFLGKVFRDGELTRLHNPEFTMAEWYRRNATYCDIQDDVEALITSLAGTDKLSWQGRTIDLSRPWKRITLDDLFRDTVGIPLSDALTNAGMRDALQTCNVHFDPEDTWETLFFRIFLECIEPHLGIDAPIFVEGYPASMGMMAKTRDSDPRWVERTELYIAGLELANGYSELLDAEEQKRRFLADQQRNRELNLPDGPLDTDLLDALSTDIPPSAGIAMGIDRLIMLLTDSADIQDVLPFPMHQWMKSDRPSPSQDPHEATH